MHFPLGSLALFLLLVSPTSANAEALDCQSYLTGHWVGVGEVETFGQSIKVDNRIWLHADGSFRSENKFQTPGKAWQEQTMEGKWSAEPGEEADACRVSMAIEGTLENGGNYSSSSTSTYIVVDADTFTSLDFPMTRMPVQEEASQ